jgi:hypothetical protein
MVGWWKSLEDPFFLDKRYIFNMLKRETIHNTTDSAVDETGNMRLGTQKMVAGGIDDTDW